jgi:hypothetical protein
MPTIWTMGDSHSGHLQGMLYELHKKLGVGVHLIETPGWSFPLPAGKQFAPRQKVFDEIYATFKPGDIVLIPRLYLSRSYPYTIEELRPWDPERAQQLAVMSDRQLIDEFDHRLPRRLHRR